jgi:predicted RNase H-like nuclease (RuvC/YqgF family)
MPEEKKRSGVKVCGWLSDEVFSKLVEKGYKSHTVIVRHGAELIIGQPIGEQGDLAGGTTEGARENTGEQTGCTREQLEGIGELNELRAQVGEQGGQIEEQREHLEKHRERIEELKAELDKAERGQKEHVEALGELRELRIQTREQREQIETLKSDLDRAERDKEDLKTVYNNYFLQVQTLINQKAIEAPGAKKPWWQFW